MSLQGIILIDITGILFMLVILNFVRTKMLHVGYAIIWLFALVGVMAIVSIPPLLELLPVVVGAIYPASAISLLAFIFIFFILVFFSVQLSRLSVRQVELIQALAIKDLQLQEAASRQDNDEQAE